MIMPSLVLRIALVFMWALPFALASCVSSSALSEASAQSALNVIADAVDPSYELAMQGCIAREEVLMSAGEAGKATPDETEAAIATTQKRCHEVEAAFEAIRNYHTQAVQYVEAGKYDEALQQIDLAREAWKALLPKAVAP
jgi:hypothetical protein